ncbi:MAG: phosphotransferase [Clostridia bacterium]|nr:phosphotransferase [Clostridia bacterium]
MKEKLISICRNFKICGKCDYIKTINNGLINSTFEVGFIYNEKINKYLVQKINTSVFKKPHEVMENIINVTEHVKAKLQKTGGEIKRRSLDFKTAKNGQPFVFDEENGCWRVCDFIDDSTTFDVTSDLFVIKESGLAFGEFLGLLADFPVHKLNITIPHFHNTQNRYEIFKNAISNNLSKRADNAKNEIDGFLDLESVATQMYTMQKNNELLLKVTHNDTKCNNVLFDQKTHKYLCVIDLDLVMPGLVGFDFGDAVRFIASTAKEDEADLSKVGVDIEKFKAFASGFLCYAKDRLTQKEKDTLVLGSITITIELGIRFLTDYLDGDKYFKTSYPEHNLIRARCQLKLANEMLKNRKQMEEIISQLCKN